MSIDDALVADFVRRHQLPESFGGLIGQHYAPLVQWIRERRCRGRTLLLGINGAQGTGKSTLADFLRCALHANDDWQVAVLSLDDFYLTRAERALLAKTVHPLLAIRGVPGTHDTTLLRDCLRRLRMLQADQHCQLPGFDKAADDRQPVTQWPCITGPVDVVVLEGWCVGSVAQSAAALHTPINALERTADPRGIWRRYVNEQLRKDYAQVFEDLDALVYLQAPDFAAVRRWRIEQEHKLRATAGGAAHRLMTDEQVSAFIQHFERISHHNNSVCVDTADVVLSFDAQHRCISSRYRRERAR